MTRSDSDATHLICAIITPNYLSQFLILGQSLALAMPDAVLRVLILQDCNDVEYFQSQIDEYLAGSSSGADHRAITIDQVNWEDFDIESAVLFYNTLEFATSVKPALMRSFLAQGWQRVTYLDPDIQVFQDFTHLLDDDADVCLTPHIFTDILQDGYSPSSHDILQAGFYNLGFCSARPTALPFLSWWSGRLQFDCLLNPAMGYFTDQRILDFATLRAKVQTLVAPGCNVAYWNLHERNVILDQGEWKITYAGSVHPLYFFHFSGFQLDRSASLSRHATPYLGDLPSSTTRCCATTDSSTRTPPSPWAGLPCSNRYPLAGDAFYARTRTCTFVPDSLFARCVKRSTLRRVHSCGSPV